MPCLPPVLNSMSKGPKQPGITRQKSAGQRLQVGTDSYTLLLHGARCGLEARQYARTCQMTLPEPWTYLVLFHAWPFHVMDTMATEPKQPRASCAAARTSGHVIHDSAHA